MATARPSDMGMASRKTVMDADTSAPAIRNRPRRGGGGGLCGRLTPEDREGRELRDEWSWRVGTQADICPVSSWAARSREFGDAAVDHGVQRRDISTLGKQTVMESKEPCPGLRANGPFSHPFR